MAEIIQMKSKPQSVNALITQAKAAWDRADEKQADANDWLIRTGKLLVDIQGRTKRGEWADALKKMGRSERRARELMELAKGKKTVEQQRERKRASMKKTRAKAAPRGAGSREGGSLDGPEVAAMIAAEVDEMFIKAHPEYAESPQEIWLNNLASLCADVTVRFARWDKALPGWRDFECPSHVAKLVDEAATALASITAKVAKRDRKRA